MRMFNWFKCKHKKKIDITQTLNKLFKEFIKSKYKPKFTNSVNYIIVRFPILDFYGNPIYGCYIDYKRISRLGMRSQFIRLTDVEFR
jgi:hypothetical protein